MVRRVAFGAALLLGLLLPACAPVGPVNPISVPDPYALSANSTTVDLTNVSGKPRFVGTVSQTFSDLPAGLLPPVPVTSYTLTLAIVEATVTGPTAPPNSLSLTSPAATVTLSDGSILGVAFDLTSSATWTLQLASSNAGVYTYTVSGPASLVTTIDPSVLAQVVSVTNTGGDNTAQIYFGVTSTGVPVADTLTLQFGPGSAVYTF